MVGFANEQEQIEFIQKWWREYGRSVIFGVIMAVLALVGIRQWQQHKSTTEYGASVHYQTLIENMVEEDTAEMEAINQTLQNKYASTPYADAGSLLLAKHYVYKKDYEKAKQQLQFVIKHDHNKVYTALAKIRFARVQAELKQYDQAFMTLASIHQDTFAPFIDEVKGDIFLAKGDEAKAKEAYQRVMHAYPARKVQNPLIQTKFDDLKGPANPTSHPVAKEDKQSNVGNKTNVS